MPTNKENHKDNSSLPIPYSNLEDILLEAEGLGIKSEVLKISGELIYQNPFLDFNQIVSQTFNQIKKNIYGKD